MLAYYSGDLVESRLHVCLLYIYIYICTLKQPKYFKYDVTPQSIIRHVED